MSEGRLKAIESITQSRQVVETLRGFFQTQAGECALALDGLDEALRELNSEQETVEKLESRLGGLKELLLADDKEKDDR